VTDADILVRPARVEDIASVHSCLDAVAREQRYLAFLEAPALEQSRAYWSGMIERGYPFEAAFAGPRAVGWCDITPLPRPVLAHGRTLGMGLHADYRGRGVGRRLLAATIEHAWRYGFERIEPAVFADNLRARRLYESLGFTPEGVLRRHRKVNGIYEDGVVMALLRES
jgi:RimJ/RimL family protein N-acetyltransferase